MTAQNSGPNMNTELQYCQYYNRQYYRILQELEKKKIPVHTLIYTLLHSHLMELFPVCFPGLIYFHKMSKTQAFMLDGLLCNTYFWILLGAVAVFTQMGWNYPNGCDLYYWHYQIPVYTTFPSLEASYPCFHCLKKVLIYN